MEQEIFYFDDAEVALETYDNQPARLAGYAMKFNVLSRDRGGYRDVFRPGVFGDITGQDIKAYLDHEASQYLGRTSNNSLQLWLDNIGLRFALDLPDTTVGRDTRALVERNDLSGMSFGVVIDSYNWKDETTGPIREIMKAQLHEVSVVFNPAFPKTELALASLQQWRDEQDEPTAPPEEIEATKEPETPNLNRAKRLLRISDLSA